MKAFLQDYANQIKYIQDNNISPKTSLLTATASTKTDVSYLCKTKWDQANPYNYYLSGNYTGCVATAMSQVMYYWQWPQSATSTIPAYTVSGKTYSALDPVTFNWSKMQTTYNSGDYEDGHAVATLMEYVGHGVKMQYSTSGSGAYETDIINALKNYFGYTSPMKLLYRSELSATEWQDTIYNNLKNSLPVIMCGSNSEGGHCFVCDGYSTQYTNQTDGSGYYHINWGWSGSYDGYFDLEVMTPEGTGSGASGSDGYTSNRSIVLNIYNPNKTVPVSAADSIPLAIKSVRLLNADSTLTRASRVVNADASARLFMPISVDSAGTYTTGIGLYDLSDNLISVYGSRSRSLTTDGSYVMGSVNFGAEIPYGTYKMYPVFKNTKNEWTKVNSATHRYVTANVKSDGTSISFRPSRGVSAVISQTSSGSDWWGDTSYTQTLTITNNGTEAFTGAIYVICGNTVTDEVDVEDLAVGASKSYDVTSYIGSGSDMSKYSVFVTGSLYLTDLLWTNVSDIIDYGFDSSNDWDGTTLIGNTLNFKITPVNLGSSASSQTITATLYKKRGTKLSNGTAKSQSVSIPAFSQTEASFDFTGLTYGTTYDMVISYKSEGSTVKDTISSYGYTIVPSYGIVIKGNSTYEIASDASASSWSIPSDAYYVDARNSQKSSSIKPNSNPNCLYLLASGATTPSNLSGYNVVVGSTAENITLKDGYDFYSPIDFTATKINYLRTFANGYNGGEAANWETMLLPFDVTSATVGGTTKDWFHSKSDTGKNFWVLNFGSESDNTVVFNYANTIVANTPYIIAVPGDKWGATWNLAGKEISFNGSNASIKATSKGVTTFGADKKYDFIGRSYSSTHKMIYALNDAGSNFANLNLSSTNISPFRAYFVGYFNNAEQTMKMRIGDGDDAVTAIGGISIAPTSKVPDIYTLDGKKVGSGNSDFNKLPKGIYIMGNKKVIK